MSDYAFMITKTVTIGDVREAMDETMQAYRTCRDAIGTPAFFAAREDFVHKQTYELAVLDKWHKQFTRGK